MTKSDNRMKSYCKISIFQRKETYNDYLNWEQPLLRDQTEYKEKAMAI